MNTCANHDNLELTEDQRVLIIAALKSVGALLGDLCRRMARPVRMIGSAAVMFKPMAYYPRRAARCIALAARGQGTGVGRGDDRPGLGMLKFAFWTTGAPQRGHFFVPICWKFGLARNCKAASNGSGGDLRPQVQSPSTYVSVNQEKGKR